MKIFVILGVSFKGVVLGINAGATPFSLSSMFYIWQSGHCRKYEKILVGNNFSIAGSEKFRYTEF